MEGQTDQTMTKGKRTNNDLKSLHKQIEIERHEPSKIKPVVTSERRCSWMVNRSCSELQSIFFHVYFSYAPAMFSNQTDPTGKLMILVIVHCIIAQVRYMVSRQMVFEVVACLLCRIYILVLFGSSYNGQFKTWVFLGFMNHRTQHPPFSIFFPFHFHGLEICKTAIICRFLIASVDWYVLLLFLFVSVDWCNQKMA